MTQDTNILGAQITASAVIVWTFRVLEGRFPKLAQANPWAKRTITFLLAGLAAAGIHANYNVVSGGAIYLPPLAVVLHGGWDWLRSVAVQEWIHRSTK